MRATNLILRHFSDIHSPFEELPESSINEKFKERLILFFLVSGKEGHLCGPQQKAYSSFPLPSLIEQLGWKV